MPDREPSFTRRQLTEGHVTLSDFAKPARKGLYRLGREFRGCVRLSESGGLLPRPEPAEYDPELT